jgi:single-strand DNA-binding protein
VNEPQIHLTGNLAFDPEVRYTPTGVAVVDLRVASTRRYKIGEDWHDGETLWFDVACWKQLAENVAGSLHKGDKVTVAGRLTQRTWTREDGTASVKLVVDATAVGIELSRFPVRVLKPARDGSAAEAFPERWADPVAVVPVVEEELAA